MRALVTGAAGFLGAHLTERLLGTGHDVQMVDSLTPYYDPSIKEARVRQILGRHPAARFVRADLASDDLGSLVDGVDVVFHLAGQPGVRASWGPGFSGYAANNVVATQRLLEAAAPAGVGRFVFASSSSIYGDAERHPTPEDALPAPVSPYGVTKLAAEHLVGAYGRSFGLPAVSLRYFTVYGPGQRPDMAFHRFILAALAGEPITIYGDGEQSRDFTFVADAVEATLAAAEAPGASGEAINVGGGSVVTVNECLRVLAEIAGHSIEVRHADRQAGDARHTSADLTKARRSLGYMPTVSLQEGLRVEWEWLASLA